MGDMMEPSYVGQTQKSFEKLVSKYGFRKQCERKDGQMYSVEYWSRSFIIRIEKYRHEFYATLRKAGDTKHEINLFNLLQYLSDGSNCPKSNYFCDERNVDERYRKQLEYISDTVFTHFVEIDDFFNSKDYESRVADIERFMMESCPGLFRKK